jgi:uncharacterized iron-regulated membrane protein
MSVKAFKAWYLVHKWTSLICTAFLLLLCLTGLPLIFHHEIEHLTGEAVELRPLPAGTASVPLDQVIAAGRARFPGFVMKYVSWDLDEPGLGYVSMAPQADAPVDDYHYLTVDLRTAEILNEHNPGDLDFMDIMFRLHVDLFAGLPGKLFLGFMGLLFAAAIVTGIAVYGPLMRKLDFGTVRKQRSGRIKWLDLHNLLGIVTLTWALAVGLTGTINTAADLIMMYWQRDQLTDMVRPYLDRPPVVPAQYASLDAALATARKAAPGMAPRFIAYPGTPYTSAHHYAVFMHGDTPLTARLLKPVLVDAQTAAFTDSRDLPWYATTLLLSQPLHFGDYGGLPLKAIWALLDVITIIVLGSGLYLWLARRRSPVERRIAELERAAIGGLPSGGAARHAGE